MAPRAVVVGGGIGGLTAALELRRLGFEVTVVERRRELADVDTGFLLWAFAIRRLRALGLGVGLARIGRPVRRVVTRSSRGRTLSDVALAQFGERIGAPSYDVHRAGLERLLSDALGAERIRLGSSCVSTTEEPSHASAILEGGERVSGDLLIGADGVNSVVRRHIAGDVALRRDGVVVWRGLAELPDDLVPDGIHIRVMGSGALFGLGRLGSRVRWYAGAWEPGRDSPLSVDRKRELSARFAGWCSPVGEAIAATDEAAVLVNDAPRAAPLRRWGHGRVTLLGDAAHPTLPSLASGGGMAIEDAGTLADCLQAAADPVDALSHYERRRRGPAARVQRASAAFGYLLARRSPPVVRLRDLGFRHSSGVQRRALALLMRGGRLGSHPSP